MLFNRMMLTTVISSNYLSEEFVEEEGGGQKNEADLHVLGSVHTDVGGRVGAGSAGLSLTAILVGGGGGRAGGSLGYNGGSVEVTGVLIVIVDAPGSVRLRHSADTATGSALTGYSRVGGGVTVSINRAGGTEGSQGGYASGVGRVGLVVCCACAHAAGTGSGAGGRVGGDTGVVLLQLVFVGGALYAVCARLSDVLLGGEATVAVTTASGHTAQACAGARGTGSVVSSAHVISSAAALANVLVHNGDTASAASGGVTRTTGAQTSSTGVCEVTIIVSGGAVRVCCAISSDVNGCGVGDEAGKYY